MSKSKSLATKNKKKKTRTSKKMSCLDWLMALRLSPVYLHTLKWHWHWKCLCHCQWHRHRGRQALLPPPSPLLSLASTRVLYCIVLLWVVFCCGVWPTANRAEPRRCSCFRFRQPLSKNDEPAFAVPVVSLSSRIALLTVVVNGITIFSPGFVLRQFMSDCIDWLAALVVQSATFIVCVLGWILLAKLSSVARGSAARQDGSLTINICTLIRPFVVKMRTGLNAWTEAFQLQLRKCLQFLTNCMGCFICWQGTCKRD